jgi:ferredoxin
VPDFRAAACTRFRYRYSECRRCADACPHDAIELSDQGASLLAGACKECGLCISACHTQAWSNPGFNPIELLREAIKRPAWRMACEPSGCEGDARVPCLGAIDASWLAYMSRRRIPVSLQGADHCKSCAHGRTGEAQLQLNLQAVAMLRDAAKLGADELEPAADWVMPALADDARTPKARDRDIRKSRGADERRALFRRVFRRSGDSESAPVPTGPAKPPQQAIRAGAYLMSERRELLQIVTQRKDEQPMWVGLEEALPLMQLSLQSGCTLCEACFRVCPSGAIEIVENPGDWALTFQTDRCVACQVCLEVCQPRVLDAKAAFDARPGQAAITLISRNKQRCSRCDRHFVSASPEARCEVCRDDEDAFTAIFG